MKIKTNDQVKIIKGKDRGKTGKVLRSLPAMGKVVVEGLNMFTKHTKAGRAGAGQKITLAMPMEVSNVVLICPGCGKTTRVGYVISASGEKSRVCKKCQESVEVRAKK